MTRLRSGKIADTNPRASRKDITIQNATAEQRSVQSPNIATEEESDSTDTVAIADIASTLEDDATNNPACSTPKGQAVNGLALAKSTTDKFLREVDALTTQDAPPVVSTQPVDTASNNFAPTTSATDNTALTTQDVPPIVSIANNDFTPTTSATDNAALTNDSAEHHAANGPLPSVSDGSVPSAAFTREADSAATQDTPSTPQPVNAAANDSVLLSTASTAAIVETPTIATDYAPVPSTDAVSTSDAPSSHVSTTSSQEDHLSSDQGDEAHSGRRSVSFILPPLTGKTGRKANRGIRKSNRRARKRNSESYITKTNHPSDPIIIPDDTDDEDKSNEPDDVPISHSIAQVLQHRQQLVETMKSSLDNLGSYIYSTPDTDESGDYKGTKVGEKRSFKEFLDDEIDSSDQPKLYANDVLDEIRKYQAMLKRTKEFQHEL